MARCLAAALAAMPWHEAHAASRSGREVVEAVCAACHATGAYGAPRIGDARAWAPRAALGLTGLTRIAIRGIRRMPPHGGNPGVSDFELELAITYMVNRSGGHWVVPIDKSALPAQRTGEQVVRARCASCHETGAGGAPRIGDRGAWIPRLNYGFEALVRSAISGHGGMPPRGGMSDLTDAEVRRAIVYMLDGSIARNNGKPQAPPALAAPPGPQHKVVEGIEVYLGVLSARTLRDEHVAMLDAESSMHGGIPRGEGYYHVNVSLFDASSGAPITDAEVRVTVTDPIMGDQSRNLEFMVMGNAVSYGDYFRIDQVNPHTIRVAIRRNGSSPLVTASFDLGDPP